MVTTIFQNVQYFKIMKIFESYSHKNIFKRCVLLCGEKHQYTTSYFLLFLKKKFKKQKKSSTLVI